jgi:hypothetical protein
MIRSLTSMLVVASLGLACSSSRATSETPPAAPAPAPAPAPAEAGQAAKGACLDPSAMKKERYEEVRAQLQANGYVRDDAAEKALSTQMGKTVECYRPGAAPSVPGLGFEAPAGWSQPENAGGANGWMNPAGTTALQYSLTGPLSELSEGFTEADLLRVVESFAAKGMNLPPPSKPETGRTASGLRYAGGMFIHSEAGTMWLWAVTAGRGPTIWVTLTGSPGQEELDAARRFLYSLRLD